MRVLEILLLLALLWPGHASRRLQPLTRGGDGDKTVDDAKYVFGSTYTYSESTTPSENNIETNRLKAQGDTQQNQSVEAEDYRSTDNVLERAKPTLTTNGGGATLLVSGNETLGDNTLPTKREQIVGGTATPLGSYAFFVHGANPNDITKICGGVLVHSDIFLTAASCRTLFFEGSEVFIGSTNLLSTFFADSRTISEKKPHPDYDAVSGENDLMIVKLDLPSTKVPADFNRVPNFPTIGESLTVIGFGWTNIDEEVLSQNLQQASIPVVDFAQCEVNNNLAVSEETQICAGQTTGGADACDFDTGGPLLTADGAFLYGINSFAVGCGFPDSEGIFTRVSAFQAFIEDGICELSAVPPTSCSEEPVPTLMPTTLGSAPAPVSNLTPTPAAPQPGQSISPLSRPSLSISPTIQSGPSSSVTNSPTRNGDNSLFNGKGKGRRKGKGKGEKRYKGKRSGKKSSKKSSKKFSWSVRSWPDRQEGRIEQHEAHKNIFGRERPLKLGI